MSPLTPPSPRCRLTDCAVALLALLPASLHAVGFDQQSYTPSHDTYIQRGAPTSAAGSGDEFLVKRDSATVSGGSDRIGYLRFSTAAPYTVVDSASLFISINNYPGNGTTPFTFEVFGLPDGHANESFDESLLTFNTATNATTTLPGSLKPAGLTSLGTFTPSVASGATRVEFSTTALRDFIAASGNSELTFIIFRQTAHGSLPTYFASAEDATATKRPTLLIRTGSDSLAVATTASSTLAGSAAANATDSHFTTRWSANADTSSTKSWLTLDLGSPQTVNRLNFIAYQHGRTYKLESSADNSTWSVITDNFRSGVGTAVNPLLQATNRYFQPRSARYFRLSSITSTTGNSLSLWEVKLYNDSTATPALARLASLTSSVSALPNTTNPEQLKRVVLELALERAQACLNIGDFPAANLLLDDAENNLATAAATMAAAATGLTEISATRALVETSPETNPYLKRINNGAALSLGTTDLPWEKNTPDLNVLADFNVARTIAGDMDALLWVFAHPNSALRHHPEILRRLLRRTYAYLDAINVHGPQIPAGQLASFYDDFASAPASIVFREFQLLYPGLIPANSNTEWNNAMTTAADNLWAAFKNRNASWVNTDVAIAVELHNLGMKTGRQELIDKGRYFIDDVLTSGRMFADGAVGYIGTQNEAGGYQGTVTTYVNRYYRITNRPQALEILQKMEWYGPINGRMIDWWTSPSWKHAWNFIGGSGQTGEPTNGKNPYTRADLDASIAATATATNWSGAVLQVGWYKTGTVALTRPDTYTVFDRNIQGPRSWQGGLWNTTGTLRAINDSESGHFTIMGAQVMDPDPNFRVNASVMGVFPRIRTATGGSRDSDGTFAEARHAWLTSKLSGDSTVTPDFSAIGASHKIHVYGSSTKGTEHDWTARQVWLNLPDRTIGLLDLAPNANLSAYEVQGAIRLGFGGTAYSPTKTLVATGTNAWSYGNLRIKLHDHNYAEVVPEQYAFRNANAPITEITLRDQVGGASNNTLNTYTAGTRWRYLAEIRPNTTTSDVTVTEVAEAGGLIGLEITGPGADKKYRVLYNPGTAAVVHTPALAWGGPVRIYQSGTHFRPDWVPDPSGALPVNLLTNGQAIPIEPKAHVVLELLPAPEVSVIIASPAAEPVTLATTSQALHFTSSITQTGVGTPVFFWSQTSGPGTATFSDSAAQNPSATFSAPGTYILRLTATVDPTVAFAERTIIVQPAEGASSTNPLPNISPGTAPNATVGTAAALTGTAPNATSTLWQKISGPGNVIFADATAPTTTATFDRAGAYQLHLSASNSNGTTSAVLTVIVSHADAFSAWLELQWGTETNPTIIGPNADPDNDGLANLAEFYAATDPKSASSTAPNLWSATTTGPPLPWSESAHWTYGASPLASPATALEFLTNQTLAAGSITANHDLASPFTLNLLTLNGTSTEAARLLLTGNALQFSANGSTTPVLNLNATGTLAYEIANPVTLNANATIQGNGTASFEISGPLSGAGTLTKNGTSKLTLSGNNSFTGAITHNAGKLALTHSNALGTATKTLSMQGLNRVLELSNHITLPASLSITASSISIDGGGIHNLSGNNRINGKINFSTGNPGLNIASSSGTLTIANNVTLVTSSRTLYLGGSSTADNTITGAIGQNNSTTNVLSVIKQGGGTWILAGTNTHTGTTSLNAGTLVVNGSITSSSPLTVAATATLAGTGSLASPTTVHGILSPGHASAAALTFTGALNLTEKSAVNWDLTSHTSTDLISAATVTITDGALVNLRLNREGSTVSFTAPFWSAARSWPILTATTLTGSLALGQVSSDSTGISPDDGHGRFSLETTSTGIILHWTPFTDREIWRQQNFGSADNSGNAADTFDPDHDGLTNLLEWALDLDPTKPGPAPTVLALETNAIRYTYTRRKAAVSESTFAIEWSDTLSDPWTPVGPGFPHSETATQETLQATIPEGSANRRFVRLRVSAN